MDRTEILAEVKKYRYAHRGLHDKPKIPENSLAAFSRAAERGFGIELDVHLTADAKLAVIHDSSLKRVTTVRADGLALTPENAGLESEKTTLSGEHIEDITLDEAKHFRLEESEERIPELREVLNLIDGRVPIIVEIKAENGNHREISDAVMRELEDYKGLFMIESFNPLVIKHLKEKYPETIRGQLATDVILDEGSRVENDPRETVSINPLTNIILRDLFFNILTKPDFVAYNFKRRENKKFRKFSGMKFYWTITEPSELEIAEKSGGICIFERFIPRSPFFRGEI